MLMTGYAPAAAGQTVWHDPLDSAATGAGASCIQGRGFAQRDYARLPEPAREDHREIFKVRYDDIDVNHHVNNAVYPLWATEAVPADFRLKHTPAALEIAFKKEGLFGEEVVIRTEIDGLVTLHGIYADDDNRELAKIRIRWK